MTNVRRPTVVPAAWRVAAVLSLLLTVATAYAVRRPPAPADVGPTVRLYDVRDLMAAVGRWADQTDPGWRTPRNAANNGNCFAPSLSQQVSTASPEQDEADEVKKLLQDNVQPELWKDNGGEVGEAQCDCGYLLVRLTPEGHRDLAAFLARLRLSMAGTAK